jgi:hypothetical protein
MHDTTKSWRCPQDIGLGARRVPGIRLVEQCQFGFAGSFVTQKSYFAKPYSYPGRSDRRFGGIANVHGLSVFDSVYTAVVASPLPHGSPLWIEYCETKGSVRLLNSNIHTRVGSVRLKRRFRSRCGSLQLLKPRTHVLTLSTSSGITVFTVWTVDFQDGQQVATPTSQSSSFVSRGKIQKARWTETIDDGQGPDCSKVSSLKESNSRRIVSENSCHSNRRSPEKTCSIAGAGMQDRSLCSANKTAGFRTSTQTIRLGVDQSAGASACMMKIRPQAGSPRGVGWSFPESVRQVEFSPAVEANLIRAVFDREHAAQVTVSAAENKLEHSQQEFHKSCARWRRSQLPLASSQHNRDRTLDRARAIAQSAAP